MRKKSLLLAALLAVAGIGLLLWPLIHGSRLESQSTQAAQPKTGRYLSHAWANYSGEIVK